MAPRRTGLCDRVCYLRDGVMTIQDVIDAQNMKDLLTKRGMVLLAVDPGGLTGLAQVRTARGFDSIEFGAWQDSVKFVQQSARSVHPVEVHLAVEHYTISIATAKSTPQYDALYCIGALEYLAWTEPNITSNFRLPGCVCLILM